MARQITVGSSILNVNNNLRVGVSATASISTPTGQVVTFQNGLVTNVMPPGGGPAMHPNYLTNITDEINALSTDVNAVNPCAQIQALVNQTMGDLQLQITGIEAQIKALLPIITIPGANLGAIVGWIRSFAAPSIQASLNYAIQLEQMLAAVAHLTAAIEIAASRLTNCTISVPTPSVSIS